MWDVDVTFPQEVIKRSSVLIMDAIKCVESGAHDRISFGALAASAHFENGKGKSAKNTLQMVIYFAYDYMLL